MSLLAALTLADYDGVSGTSITYFYDKSIRVVWVGGMATSPLAILYINTSR